MVSEGSLAQSRFAVCEINERKEPVGAPFAVVEGKDWGKAAQLAFSAARPRLHADKHIATGVFELHDTHARCIATAGYARLWLPGWP
jgi:hypothetical protein